MTQKSYLKPALLGGVVAGVLSWIPGVNLLNCLCCMWIIVGGVLAAYFLGEQTQRQFTTGDGAIVGLLSGVFAGLVGGLINMVTFPFLGMKGMAEAFERLRQVGQMPPEAQAIIEKLLAGGGAIFVTLLVFMLLGIIIDALFGTIGGLIGSMMFAQKQERLQPPPPMPPSPSV